MPQLDRALTGVTIVLNVRGQPFTLTAPTARITVSSGGGGAGGGTGGGGSQALDEGIYFDYEKPYEESLDLGTPGEVLDAIQQLTQSLPGGTGTDLADQWDTIRQKLARVPVLNQATEAMLQTQVRMTRFGIGFVPVPLVTPKSYAVIFTLGLVFVPTPGSLPTLFGTTLTRFGAVFSVAGSATAAQLGLPD